MLVKFTFETYIWFYFDRATLFILHLKRHNLNLKQSPYDLKGSKSWNCKHIVVVCDRSILDLMIKSRLLQGNETNSPVSGFQNSTSAFRLTNQRSPAGVHVGRSPKARRWAISEAPMVRNYKLLPIAANSLFNRLPPSAFQQALPPLSFRSSGSPKMASNESSKPENEDQLKAIFEQKRVLRSSVRKALKAMDPSLRSQEGTNCLHILID